ncbi:MAG: molybdopterin converting factor subunit 1 [Rhodobacteraceae bacterium]|nr:molybdopterin converting factor subunit 1 [Paracoccaceae bacterium]
MVDLRYFAWLRERIGTSHEQMNTDAETVADLVEELKARDDVYAQVFSDPAGIRVAVDQELVEFDAPLKNTREVAFFPPMTGG